MSGLLALAAQNLTSPMVLFFVLGLAAAFARSDLAIPEAIAKTLALYLMMSIGFKGGVEVSKSGLSGQDVGLLLSGMVLSALLPLLGFWLLRRSTRLSAVDAAAVAAHYGSISIVTFVAASQALSVLGIEFNGILVAVAAVMETPAILTALILARTIDPDSADGEPANLRRLLHDATLNSSVVMLTGSFVIGWITGPRGLEMIAPLVVDPFRGLLCLFLLDMGLIAGRGLTRSWRELSPGVVLFGLYMPIVSAVIAAVFAWLLGLSTGSAAMFITLAASASYIAVPAAMRLALPQAQPSIYLTLSLGITFPFNLTLGIPLYVEIARRIAGSP